MALIDTIKEKMQDKMFLMLAGGGLAMVILIILLAVFHEPEQSENKIMTSGQAGETREEIREEIVEDDIKRFKRDFKKREETPIEEDLGEFVLKVPRNLKSVAQQLIDKGVEEAPLPGGWEGDVKPRRFNKGMTLLEGARKYVEEAGLTLIWDLDKDVIVTHWYNSNGTLTRMLEEMGGALDIHYIGDVTVYLCHRKHALVITDKPHDYLIERCQKTSQ